MNEDSIQWFQTNGKPSFLLLWLQEQEKETNAIVEEINGKKCYDGLNNEQVGGQTITPEVKAHTLSFIDNWLNSILTRKFDANAIDYNLYLGAQKRRFLTKQPPLPPFRPHSLIKTTIPTVAIPTVTPAILGTHASAIPTTLTSKVQTTTTGITLPSVQPIQQTLPGSAVAVPSSTSQAILGSAVAIPSSASQAILGSAVPSTSQAVPVVPTPAVTTPINIIINNAEPSKTNSEPSKQTNTSSEWIPDYRFT